MKLEYLKDVVTLELNSARCIGCGMCAEVCPHQIFAIIDGKAQIVERDMCMECGACAMNCPSSAINAKKGVGCAYAVMMMKIKGKDNGCECSCDDTGCC